MDRFKSISSFDVPKGHPISVFDQFWTEQVRISAPVPWSSFSPMMMPSVLPWILLLDHLPNGDFQYRLCGTGCEQLLGVNLTGHKFGENVNKKWAHKSREEFDAIMAGKGPFYSKGKLPVIDRDYIEMRRAVYGFSSDGLNIDRIMAIVAPVDQYRLSIAE